MLEQEQGSQCAGTNSAGEEIRKVSGNQTIEGPVGHREGCLLLWMRLGAVGSWAEEWWAYSTFTGNPGYHENKLGGGEEHGQKQQSNSGGLWWSGRSNQDWTGVAATIWVRSRHLEIIAFFIDSKACILPHFILCNWNVKIDDMPQFGCLFLSWSHSKYIFRTAGILDLMKDGV